MTVDSTRLSSAAEVLDEEVVLEVNSQAEARLPPETIYFGVYERVRDCVEVKDHVEAMAYSA